MNNVARVTIQALAATLGGTQSLHTNGYDEALGLPTEEAAKLALRTQQILASESGVRRTADPLGGSYYIEALTDEIECMALKYLQEIEDLGGASRAIGYMIENIQDAAYKFQLDVESGDREIIGVNKHLERDELQHPHKTNYEALEREQVARIISRKRERGAVEVAPHLERISRGAHQDENLMPLLIAAVKAGATLGELSNTLRVEWGTYDG